MTRALSLFLRNRRGAAMAEFTIVLPIMIMLILGAIEFSSMMWTWNAAAKAAQAGARLAVVSAPVGTLPTGLEGGATPGEAMPYFRTECSGATGSCSGGGYNAAAMTWIVRGRDGACNAVSDLSIGMCDIYDRITPQNVTIIYEQTGLGYAGRPGGPVPTVTVRLTGLTFATPILAPLINATGVTLPPFSTTVTGEDLASGAP